MIRSSASITDPVIMSTTQEYGPTDLISTFFARHKCNKFCNKQWVMPHDKKVYFKVQKGSAMVLPTRTSRVPLTGNGAANGGIDSGYASMTQLPELIEGLEIIEE